MLFTAYILGSPSLNHGIFSRRVQASHELDTLAGLLEMHTKPPGKAPLRPRPSLSTSETHVLPLHIQTHTPNPLSHSPQFALSSRLLTVDHSHFQPDRTHL